MHNSLEGRTPFIDKMYLFIKVSPSLDQKLSGKQGKYTLKAWLDEHLPEARPLPVNAALPYLSASGLNPKLTRWAVPWPGWTPYLSWLSLMRLPLCSDKLAARTGCWPGGCCFTGYGTRSMSAGWPQINRFWRF